MYVCVSMPALVLYLSFNGRCKWAGLGKVDEAWGFSHVQRTRPRAPLRPQHTLRLIGVLVPAEDEKGEQRKTAQRVEKERK